jgi:hypothetical protein
VSAQSGFMVARPLAKSFPAKAHSSSDLKRGLRASLMAQVQTDALTGPPLSECIEKYFATREQDLDARALNQHRLALQRLQRFLEAQNIIHIREMTVDHLETFKTPHTVSHQRGGPTLGV